jgi:hypothetical protein
MKAWINEVEHISYEIKHKPAYFQALPQNSPGNNIDIQSRRQQLSLDSNWVPHE